MSRVTIKTHTLKSLTEKFNQMAETGRTDFEVAQLHNQLKTNLAYTQEKFKAGQINFGDTQSSAANHYDLMMALHEAEVALNVFDTREATNDLFKKYLKEDQTRGSHLYTDKKYDDSDHRRTELLAKLKGETDAGIAEFREKETSRQAWRSVRIGAGLGTLGAFVSGFIHVSHSHGTLDNTHLQPKLDVAKAKEQLDLFKEYNHHNPEGVPYKEWIAQRDLSEVAGEKIKHALDPKEMIGRHHVSAEDVAKHSLVSTDASVKGAGEMIRKMRNSDAFEKLSPKQREFFERNIYKVAQDLKEFNPGAAKESIVVTKGSGMGVTEDGYIYLTDKAHGAIRTLGHLDKTTGEFIRTRGANGIEYMHAEHAVSAATHQSAPGADAIARSHSSPWPEGGALLAAVAAGTRKASSETRRTYDNEDKNVSDPVPDDPYVTYGNLQEKGSIAYQEEQEYGPSFESVRMLGQKRYSQAIDKYFPVRKDALVTERPEWSAINTMSARSYLDMQGIVKKDLAEFQEMLRTLEKETKLVPKRGERVKEFAKRLFKEQALKELAERN